MAVIQPYFDPTVQVQGGALFARYLEGFMKERTETNKRIMQQYLDRADPKFLYQEQLKIRQNIGELLLIRYGAARDAARGANSMAAARLKRSGAIEVQLISARARRSEGAEKIALERDKMWLEFDQGTSDSIEDAQKNQTTASVTLVRLFRKSKKVGRKTQGFQERVQAQLKALSQTRRHSTDSCVIWRR